MIHKNDSKIFCISMQRTGTTSIGKFYRDFGFRWAGWPQDESNRWSQAWYNGDYEAILSSSNFMSVNAYEDSPWFFPGFYKILYHRFPDAKFILWMRDPDEWHKSMVNHSKGSILGETMVHSKIYRRELEYYDLLKSSEFDISIENEIATEKTMKLINESEHYKNIYKLHSTEVEEFFNEFSPGSLHIGSLDDPEKWQKLGKFLNVTVDKNYNSIENSSNSEHNNETK